MENGSTDQHSHGWLTIQESTTRLARARWLEERLFSILGRWAADTALVDAKLVFARHSRHAAWRAGQLVERLPAVGPFAADVVMADTVTELAELGWVDLVGAIEQIGRDVGRETEHRMALIEQVVSVYRVVLPHLGGAYSRHLELCSPAADAAVARTLRMVVSDVLEDCATGEQLLATLLITDQMVDHANACQAGVQQQIAATGGLIGPTLNG